MTTNQKILDILESIEGHDLDRPLKWTGKDTVILSKILLELLERIEKLEEQQKWSIRFD